VKYQLLDLGSQEVHLGTCKVLRNPLSRWTDRLGYTEVKGGERRFRDNQHKPKISKGMDMVFLRTKRW
jgi:hypothetical protein